MTRRAERLKLVAGVLAVVVAGIHLYWGIPRFAVYASIGTMPDPRPLAFVLSGHAIMAGLTIAVTGHLDRGRLYLPGMALMLAHLLGYAAWHTVFRHGVAGSEASHSHGPLGFAEAVVVVGEHLVNSPLALVSKVTEFALLGSLVALYLVERRA